MSADATSPDAMSPAVTSPAVRAATVGPPAVAAADGAVIGAAAGGGRTLPSGTLLVGVGLVVSALSAYAFLALSARALGPTRYAPLGVLWALVFLLAPGFFLPLEQEVGRALAYRRSRGVGGRPVARRAAVAGTVLVAVLIAIFSAVAPLRARLFDNQTVLVIWLGVALAAYAAEHLVRGTLSGGSRFGLYGLLIGIEGLVRLVGCGALVLLGGHTVGLFAMLVGLPAAVAVAGLLRGARPLTSEGPPAPWTELSSALGYLLASSVLAQALLNTAPFAVKLFASSGQRALAGRFLAAVVVARIPLFLFQAVQATFLPRLSGLVGAGRHGELRSALWRLSLLVTGIGVLTTAGLTLVGPWGMRTFFGGAFGVGRLDLALLAAASGAYMLALTLSQALIALSGYSRVTVGWAVGFAVTVAVTALASGLPLRAEQGFLAGALASAAAMGALTWSRLRARVRAEPVPSTDGAGGGPGQQPDLSRPVQLRPAHSSSRSAT